MSGYDIRKFIAEQISFFWHESFGSIYPLVKQLTEEGLIVSKREDNPGRPGRNILRLTPKGRKAFAQWQSEAVQSEQIKSELLLKIFLSNRSNLGSLAKQLKTFLAEQSEQLSYLRQTKSQIETEAGSSKNRAFWLMTIRRGELVAEARIKWANESLATIAKMKQGK